jgi:hypothetical protein
MQINAPRAGWFRCTRASAAAKSDGAPCRSAAIPFGLDCKVIDYIARIGTDGPRFDCGFSATRQ